MSPNPPSSIGALWTDMSRQSGIPTAEERAEQVARMRQGLPPVRHTVYMRYEQLFDEWRLTFLEHGKTICESRVKHDYTLEDLIRRGRGVACLADRQAVELGMRQQRGGVTLQLDAEQYAQLISPR